MVLESCLLETIIYSIINKVKRGDYSDLLIEFFSVLNEIIWPLQRTPSVNSDYSDLNLLGGLMLERGPLNDSKLR